MKVAALFAVVLVFLFLAHTAMSWTGPTQTPTGGNITAPVNVGSVGQEKTGGLYVSDLLEGDSLAVYGNAVLGGSSRYLHFGTTATPPENGYGIRDNAGTMQYKNFGDPDWTNIGSGGTGSLWLPAGTTGMQVWPHRLRRFCGLSLHPRRRLGRHDAIGCSPGRWR
jgi:hypothetical protein